MTAFFLNLFGTADAIDNERWDHFAWRILLDPLEEGWLTGYAFYDEVGVFGNQGALIIKIDAQTVLVSYLVIGRIERFFGGFRGARRPRIDNLAFDIKNSKTITIKKDGCVFGHSIKTVMYH